MSKPFNKKVIYDPAMDTEDNPFERSAWLQDANGHYDLKDDLPEEDLAVASGTWTMNELKWVLYSNRSYGPDEWPAVRPAGAPF